MEENSSMEGQKEMNQMMKKSGQTLDHCKRCPLLLLYELCHILE